MVLAQKMRVPAGAPVPFWLAVKNKFPVFQRFSRPSLGTVAVVVTLIITGAAVSAVTVYPKVNHDYYKQAQKEERALLRATKEELAHGQNVWKDPFVAIFLVLEELCMRTNLMTSINENLLCLKNLVELNFYENQITEIANLEPLVSLKRLDLSFNRIREIKGLSTLKNLTHLYLVHNKIPVIENLDSLTALELLELGDNRIKKIENLSNLKNLRELYLGKNKIREIEGLSDLVNLRVFSLPGNRIVKIENIDNLTELEELYISEQGLTNLAGLSNSKKLKILDVAKNEITTTEGIENLTALEDFWANDNRIESWTEVDRLRALPVLDTVYLEQNPIYTADRTGYRRKVMLALPQVNQIDATMCK
ncbi:unnamed protein product [Caenorhabditis auriculariae]|uniref:U2A'/phosphoprotein 32 family A C-terminal domain-containing protein n=1 Tax=Caenorhabditis auriculariae TaxID=2777116 RepID=A0A8S1H701_9PELO|nr:unnamed protein product [Caenorhabditis auriculariae]